jgi:hypothetical protein
VDHVVNSNEAAIDGSCVHFATVEGISGDQTPNTAKSVYFNLHHGVSWMELALHKKLQLPSRQRGTGSARGSNNPYL